MRVAIGTLAVLAITVYFWVLWMFYLNPSDQDANGLVFGRRGADAIYYSWFVIATLGLGISQYALEAIETSLLKRPFWATSDPVQVKEHLEHSWARPDGWLSVMGRLLFTGRTKISKQQSTTRRPSKLWTLLAAISLLGFFAMPLSGLAMNFDAGYYASENDQPLMIGFNNGSWNARFKSAVWQRAFQDWNTDAASSIPSSGVIYSRRETDRSSISYLASLPNTLPNDTSVDNVFLAPQAGVPISGSSWGLAVGYQCSVSTTLSDFTILRHRKPAANFTSDTYSEYTVLDGNATVRVFNETDTNVRYLFANNIQAVAEIGYDNRGQIERQSGNAPPASECYNPMDKDMPYPGLDQPQALELVLWQNLTTNNLFVVNPPTINLTLSDTIPELFGAYNTSQGQTTEAAGIPMSAIGVRCTSVSAVGTANLDGRHATFTDFQRSDYTQQAAGASGQQCAERLSLGVPSLLFSEALSSSSTPTEWLGSFFSSVGKYTQSFAQQDYNFGGSQVNLQSSYLQADELRRSLTRAYSLYALGLLYNGGVGYVGQNGSYVPTSEFVNMNATAYTRDTILVPGIVPPVVVAVLLTIWALGICILSALCIV